ncbi:hypothetical protein [Chitinophaga solisilvae]|uniref:hypothetical protein n=1 Tax=Chitinophaga solisilvae TaxID=1233460 RepID=UPI0013700627|nr:hypothetical protein [Chitinophaga solisilvae]
MKKYLIYSAVLMTIAGCASRQTKDVAQADSTTPVAVSAPATPAVPVVPAASGDEPRPYPHWMDTVVQAYILVSESALTKLAVKDSTAEWLFDQVTERDGNKFVVFQIGQDVQDGDGRRFSTCEWVYIQPQTRELYRYDLPNDELIKWTKK